LHNKKDVNQEGKKKTAAAPYEKYNHVLCSDEYPSHQSRASNTQRPS
jgi:hypothetical protein